jgi:hypothetical protein
MRQEFQDFRKVAAENEKLREQIASLRGALAFIWHSTESTAIKHRDYDHLAANVANVAEMGLDGDFVDDMHLAETYDLLKASVTSGVRK